MSSALALTTTKGLKAGLAGPSAHVKVVGALRAEGREAAAMSARVIRGSVGGLRGRGAASFSKADSTPAYKTPGVTA